MAQAARCGLSSYRRDRAARHLDESFALLIPKRGPPSSRRGNCRWPDRSSSIRNSRIPSRRRASLSEHCMPHAGQCFGRRGSAVPGVHVVPKLLRGQWPTSTLALDRPRAHNPLRLRAICQRSQLLVGTRCAAGIRLGDICIGDCAAVGHRNSLEHRPTFVPQVPSASVV